MEQHQAEQRIRELEECVVSLRFSRRLLLNLLTELQEEKENERLCYEREKQKLLDRNRRYARLIWEKNKKINEIAKGRL
ncbi:MAG: translation initiation factor 2 [Clostridia bacterium]|nr:translation initiation factor 2 [Clostridia bacterium]MDD4798113.1 translation initiation factor 2 [Clostridia bacterium]